VGHGRGYCGKRFTPSTCQPSNEWEMAVVDSGSIEIFNDC
jgi:hypothetical protein